MSTISMKDCLRVIEITDAVKADERCEGTITIVFEDGGQLSVGKAELELLTEKIYELERELDGLQDSLDFFKRRLEDVLEDF